MIQAARQTKLFVFVRNILNTYPALKRSVKRLLRPFGGRHNSFQQRTINGLQQISKEQILQRSELAALKSKYMILESQVNDLTQGTCGIDSGQSGELMLTAVPNGIFIAKRGDPISDYILSGETWNSHIIELATQVSRIREGGCAVDIGAHVGSTAIAMAPHFSEVFCFEPDHSKFRILQANVAINGLENVRLFNIGLRFEPNSMSFFKPANRDLGLPSLPQREGIGSIPHDLDARDLTESGSITCDQSISSLDSYAFDNISFINIDVREANGAALLGAVQTIRRCQPVVVFEWDARSSQLFGITLDDIEQQLGQFGYEMTSLKKHDEQRTAYVARSVVVGPEMR